ncbi:MAG: hypothetical protein JWQ64_3341 [Subtercola sp.]|nr:hypothetical protein [Subtercola sp.]
MKMRMPESSRKRRRDESETLSAAIIREPTTQISTPRAEHSRAATAANGYLIQVPTVASAAIDVMMPGMPSTPARVRPSKSFDIGNGNCTRRAGSRVCSMPVATSGMKIQPSIRAEPARTTMVPASSALAKPSAMSPTTARNSTKRPYSPPMITATSCHGLRFSEFARTRNRSLRSVVTIRAPPRGAARRRVRRSGLRATIRREPRRRCPPRVPARPRPQPRDRTCAAPGPSHGSTR